MHKSDGPNRVNTIGETVFCAFDVETTGLSERSRVVEIGATRFKMGEPGDDFCTLVDPCQAISPGAAAVHRIDREMLRGAPRAGEALIDFFDFAGDAVLIAHNAGFDVGIVSKELVRCNMPMPGNLVVDSLSIARACLGQRRNFKLSTLAESIGLDTSGLHRALPDAQATRHVFETALVGEEWMSRPLEDLHDFAGCFGFRDTRDLEVELPAEFEIIRRAIETGSCIRVVYTGGTKGPDPRLLTPMAVRNSWGTFSLEAYCHLDGMIKTFLLERFAEIELA